MRWPWTLTRKYWIKSICTLAISLWIAVTINFLIPRLMPGNPIATLIVSTRGKLGPESAKAIAKAFGLTSGNMIEGYFIYLGELFRGNLGVSIAYFPTPIITLIGESLPYTLFLVGGGLAVSFALGTFLGVMLAWRRNSRIDTVITPLLVFVRAFPYFCLAILILYFFGYKLRFIPLTGAYSIGQTPSFSLQSLEDLLYHAIGPLIVVGSGYLGNSMLQIRNNMIMTLQDDFTLIAKAKGLPDRRIMISYAARNAILPSITGLGLQIGYMMGGALLVEMVFSYPGMGYLLWWAVQYLDYPLMQAIFLIIAVTVIVTNFLLDIVCGVLDPRIGASR